MTGCEKGCQDVKDPLFLELGSCYSSGNSSAIGHPEVRLPAHYGYTIHVISLVHRPPPQKLHRSGHHPAAGWISHLGEVNLDYQLDVI